MEQDIRDAKYEVSKGKKSVDACVENMKEIDEFKDELKVFNVKNKHDKTVMRLEALEQATKKNSVKIDDETKRCHDDMGVLERLNKRVD